MKSECNNMHGERMKILNGNFVLFIVCWKHLKKCS